MYCKYKFYYNYLLKCDILVEFKTYFKYKRLELIKYIFLDYIETFVCSLMHLLSLFSLQIVQKY